MKITVRKTEKCVMLRPQFGEHLRDVYVLAEELDEILSGKRDSVFDPWYIMTVEPDSLTFQEDARFRHDDVGMARYARVRLDTKKLFKTIRLLIEKGILHEGQDVALDARSFEYRPNEARAMTIMEVVKHPLFCAMRSLKEAVKVAPPDELLRLRDTLGRLVQQGKRITDDFARASFYFYHADGKGYNGGVIWHGDRYSVHT